MLFIGLFGAGIAHGCPSVTEITYDPEMPIVNEHVGLDCIYEDTDDYVYDGEDDWIVDKDPRSPLPSDFKFTTAGEHIVMVRLEGLNESKNETLWGPWSEPQSINVYAKIKIDSGDNQVVPKDSNTAELLKAKIFDFNGDAYSGVNSTIKFYTPDGAPVKNVIDTPDQDGIVSAELDTAKAGDYYIEVDGDWMLSLDMFHEQVFGITINSIDYFKDQIVTSLVPEVSGLFELTFTGGATSHNIVSENRTGIEKYTSESDAEIDSFNIPFNNNDLDNTTLDTIKAEWTVGGKTFSVTSYKCSIKILSDYMVTNYYVPFESDFTKPNITVSVRGNDCVWSDRTFKADFVDEVGNEGTGKCLANTFVQVSKYDSCGNSNIAPHYFTNKFGIKYAFYEKTTITGSCNTNLSVGDFARNKDNTDFPCTSVAFILENRLKGTIGDTGSGNNGSLAWLDRFFGFGKQAGIGANLWGQPIKKIVKIINNGF